MNTHTLTFGRHKGKTLTEVPRNYLLWLAREAELITDDLRDAARALLNGMPSAEQRLAHAERIILDLEDLVAAQYQEITVLRSKLEQIATLATVFSSEKLNQENRQES